MSDKLNYSDTPIETPEADLFGINGFVQSLAKGLVTMKRPEGVVVALNGQWGSGKSSAINLLKHHLEPSIQEGSIEIIPFNPWWYKGQEALTLGFFKELYQATNPTLSNKGKKALSKIGSGFLQLVNTVAPTTDAFGASGVGSTVGAVAGWIGSFIEDGESIEKLHEQLAAALSEQKKRFVVMIDDIDRLNPDEAMMIFRLIKSVGRLPNITYVLAFDRALSEKMVSQQFPSEGAHYLEKIIQISFDLPLPTEATLNSYLVSNISSIIGDVDEQRIVHIQNMYHEIVSPEIRTPRDASRYLNAISLTWPAVAGEVDVGDFLALEAYRLFRSGIYNSLRDNQALLCGGTSSDIYGNKKGDGDRVEVTLLNSVADKEKYRRRLMRLFPRLESIWSNTHHNGSSWRKQRRACVAEFFPIYFRMSLPDDVVPMSEIKELISRAGDQKFIADYFRSAAETPVVSGGTRAALLLDALNAHASEIEVGRVGSLLAGLFSVADEINVAADESGAFSFGHNPLRIHWLVRALLLDRTTLDERSAIIRDAAYSASLYWSIDLSLSAWQDYHPREGKEQPNEEKRLCNEVDSTLLHSRALPAIRDASKDGSLIKNRELAWLLYCWRDLTNDDGGEVKQWVLETSRVDDFALAIANSLISNSWSQSMGLNGLGDSVATRRDHLAVGSLNSIMDEAEFKNRITDILKSSPSGDKNHQAAARFLKAWEVSLKDRQ